jgi:hypothetical protein
VEVQEGEQQRGEPALHVAGAAAVDAAVDHFAAPGTARPLVLDDGKDVHVAVEHQVAAGPRALEARHDVRHLRVRREHHGLESGFAQRAGDEVRRHPGVAGRVRRGCAEQRLQKGHRAAALGIDPRQDFAREIVHRRHSARRYAAADSVCTGPR